MVTALDASAIMFDNIAMSSEVRSTFPRFSIEAFSSGDPVHVLQILLGIRGHQCSVSKHNCKSKFQYN